jgi:hypothetical protein
MLEQTREILSKKLGVELVVTLDSRLENCADEELGEFLQCEPLVDHGSEHLSDYPPCIVIYENELVQLWHDATPYPVAANTKAEARDMMMCLNPYPVHHTLLTADDFQSFMNKLMEEAAEYDEE